MPGCDGESLARPRLSHATVCDSARPPVGGDRGGFRRTLAGSPASGNGGRRPAVKRESYIVRRDGQRASIQVQPWWWHPVRSPEFLMKYVLLCVAALLAAPAIAEE